MEDGYHWFRFENGTTFIALLEDGLWYLPGIQNPVKELKGSTYIRPVELSPHN